MNTANLQLEGLVMAVAEMNNLLVAKGPIGTEEITGALERAEQTVLGDYGSLQIGPMSRHSKRWKQTGERWPDQSNPSNGAQNTLLCCIHSRLAP